MRLLEFLILTIKHFKSKKSPLYFLWAFGCGSLNINVLIVTTLAVKHAG